MYRITAALPTRQKTPEEMDALVRRLTESAENRNLTVLGTYADHRIALLMTCPWGKKSDSRFSAFIEEPDRVVAVEGYIYDKRPGPDVQHLLTGGTELGGHFARFSYDRTSGRFELLTDRYGIKPVFHGETTEFRLIGQDFAMLVDNFGLDRCLDLSAAAQLISLEMVADDRTSIVGLKRLPHATRFVIGESGVKSEQYWDYPFGRQRTLSGDRVEILGCLARLVDVAMDIECEKGRDALVVPLSGGMDSRLIAAHMAERCEGALKTFTIGMKRGRSHEARYARRVAAALGADWDYLNLLEEMDYERDWPAFVEDTGGWVSAHQGWSTPAYRALDQPSPVRAVHGLAFDAQLTVNPSFAISDSLSFDKSVEILTSRYAMTRPGNPSRYFSSDFMERIVTEPRGGISRRLRHMEGASAEDLSDYLLWNARVKSYTSGELNGNRRYVDFAIPYLHYDLFDLVMAIPREWRTGYKFYADYFRMRFPELAHMPNGNTGSPVGEPPGLGHRIRRTADRIEYYLLRGTRGVIERSPNSFAACFRRNRSFRRTVESIFATRRVVEKGLLSDRALTELFRDIDQGHSYLFQFVLRLATLELTLRRFAE